MTVHIVLLGLIMLTGCVTYAVLKPSQKVNKRYIAFSLFLVFIVQSLRASSVGSDTLAYVKSFYLIDRQGFDWRTSAWEPCYLWLNMLVGKFTDNPQYLLAVCSAIILYGIGLFIYKNMDHTKSAFWPIFFFMVFTHYLNSMNLLRQYLAMAFVLQIFWILRDVEGKKRFVISAILVIIGVSFHKTAILSVAFFIPYLLKSIKRKTIVGIGGGIVGLTALFNYILPYVFVLFPLYVKYENSSRIEGDEGFGVYYIVYIMFKLALIIFVFMLPPDEERNNYAYKLSFINIISTGFLILKTKVSLAMRAGYYFDIFMVLLIPEIVSRLGNKKIIVYFLLIIYGVFCFMHTLDSVERGCVPYLFFWQ